MFLYRSIKEWHFNPRINTRILNQDRITEPYVNHLCICFCQFQESATCHKCSLHNTGPSNSTANYRVNSMCQHVRMDEMPISRNTGCHTCEPVIHLKDFWLPLRQLIPTSYWVSHARHSHNLIICVCVCVCVCMYIYIYIYIYIYTVGWVW